MGLLQPLRLREAGVIGWRTCRLRMLLWVPVIWVAAVLGPVRQLYAKQQVRLLKRRW